jgi:hypothetical protein
MRSDLTGSVRRDNDARAMPSWEDMSSASLGLAWPLTARGVCATVPRASRQFTDSRTLVWSAPDFTGPSLGEPRSS